jgi:hypothetical protein
VPTPLSHIKTRLHAGALSVAVALCVALARPAPPLRTTDGLSSLLARSAHGTVNPAEIVWEPAGSIVAEALFGRHVLFLATPSGTTARDLFRARMRLSAEGNPIEALGLRNLT